MSPPQGNGKNNERNSNNNNNNRNQPVVAFVDDSLLYNPKKPLRMNGQASVTYNAIQASQLSYNSVSGQSLAMSLASHLEQERGGGSDHDDDDGYYTLGSNESPSQHHQHDKTTPFQAFIHLVKGYVGPGCLSLPWAISQLGLTLGIFACFVMAYWSSYNCWTVVHIKRRLQATSNSSSERRPAHHQRDLTYADVAGRLYGKQLHRFTTACICTQQLAICTVFLSFIGANFQAVLEAVWEVQLSHLQVMTIALPSVMALSFLPDLKALAPVTAVGTALLMLGLGLLAVVMVIEWPHRHDDDDNNAKVTDLHAVNWAQAPLAFCAILYSFEGICLILPVESSIDQPRKFFKVFSIAMTTAACIFAFVASCSFVVFGNVTNGSVTAFLLQKYAHDTVISGWLMAANAAVSLSVLVTYPLQLFPCIEMVGGALASLRARTSRRPNRRDYDATTQQDNQENDDNDDEEDARTVSSSNSDLSDPDNNNNENNNNNNNAGNNNTNENNSPMAVEEQGDGIFRDESSTNPEQPSYDTPVLRMGLVLSTYLVAVLIPNVQALISLAGAVAGSSTALLLPPLLDLAFVKTQAITQQQEEGSSRLAWFSPLWWAHVRNYALLVGGIVFALIGTYASLLDILKVYSGKE